MTEAMHLVLVVEDDPALQSVLRTLFEANGYRFVAASIAAGGIRDARLYNPDVVIVDLGLPDRDGLEVIRGIRLWSQMPIVVLSARGQEKDKIAALDLGADDYVAKPFAVGELLARIRAALRRAAPVAAGDLWPLWAQLGTLPVLAIRGALSDILSASTFARMQREKPDLLPLTVASRGHVPLLDEPECLAAIDAFVARVAY